MTRYASGRRKEWDACKRLRAAGWDAQRSAGSRGLWDVVAVKRGQRPRFIQCKYTAAVSCYSVNPPASIIDANARALLALEGDDETPIEVELWVYHRGYSEPWVYTAWQGAWTVDSARAWA